MRIRLSVLCLISLLAMSVGAEAATCHVGSGQTYSTIQAGVNACTSAGDIVAIHAGTYTQAVSFPSSGSSGNPIRVQPANYTNDGCTTPGCGSGDAVTWQGGTTSVAATIADRSHIRIQGLRFANTMTSTSAGFPDAVIYAVNTFCAADAQNACKATPREGIEILNNTFEDNGNDGSVREQPSLTIHLHGIGRVSSYGGAATSTVSGNTFTDNYGYSVLAALTSDVHISDNVVTSGFGSINGSLSPPDLWSNGGFINIYGDCNFTIGTCATPDNLLIERNTIANITSPNDPQEMTGIRLDACKGPHGIIIQDNVIHDMHNTANSAADGDRQSYGVFAEAGCDFVAIRRNIIYNVRGAGLRFGRSDGANSSNGTIEHNTISGTADSAIHFSAGHDLTIQNNIFVNLRNGAETIGVENDSVGANNLFRNNLYWNSTQTGIGDWNLGDSTFGSGSLSLMSWNSNSGETGDQRADPVFVNPGAANFALQSTSPARGQAHDGSDQGAIQFGVAAGLGNIGWWTFDEASGPALDTSGQNQTCTLAGNATRASPGNIGPRALLLDGTDDYCEVTGTTALRPTSTFAISAWIKASAVDSTGGTVVSMGDSYGLYVDASGHPTCFKYSGGSVWPDHVASGASVLNGAWHHLFCQYTGSSMEIRIDDVQAGTPTSISGAITYGLGTNLQIGRHADGDTTKDFNGQIDQVKLYDTVRSSAEVTALFQEGARPADVTIVGVTADSSRQLTVSWLTAGSVAGYHIYRCSVASCTPTFFQAVGVVLSFADQSVTPNTLYRYAVTAVNAGGNESLTPSSIVQQTTSALGLVGHWTFDEVSGVALDTSGYTQTCTLAGNATRVAPGKIGGRALSLDGTDDYCEVLGTAHLKPPPLFAISGWVNATTVDSSAGTIFSMGDSYGLKVVPGGNVDCFRYNGTGWPSHTTTAINVLNGAWHHLFCQYTGSAMEIRIDDVAAGSTAMTGPVVYTLGANAEIGRHAFGETTSDFNGAIDQVKVFDTTRTGAEVTALFAEGSGTLVPPAAPTNLRVQGL